MTPSHKTHLLGARQQGGSPLPNRPAAHSNVISIHTARPLPCDFAPVDQYEWLEHRSHEAVRDPADSIWSGATRFCGWVGLGLLAIGCVMVLL